jgi:hypothetical protein
MGKFLFQGSWVLLTAEQQTLLEFMNLALNSGFVTVGLCYGNDSKAVQFGVVDWVLYRSNY